MAGTASGTCAASPRDAGGARDIASGLRPRWPLSWPRWQAPPAAQAEAGNPGQLPGSLLAFPRLSPALLLASAPRRAEPALRVCARVGGGAAAWISRRLGGNTWVGVFPLARGGCPSVLPAAVMDSIIIQERLVERLLSPRTQAQRSHPGKLKVQGCIYSAASRGAAGTGGGRMVPDKTRAAQDEPCEEQRSGKTPVREGRRHGREGSSPRGQRARGAVGSCQMLGAFVRLFDAVIPCLNGVQCMGGAQGRSQRCVCPHAVRFVLINAALMLCFAGRFPSLQQMLVGEWCCRYSCAQPQARGADVRGRCLGVCLCYEFMQLSAMKGSKGSACPPGLGCAGPCRRGCGGRAWPEGKGWRKGCLGGS